ncbi:HIT-like protein, partial [Wallemia mellicola CBS 633.66]
MNKQLFHKFDVTSQTFYRSKLSAAFVNLKPIVPGHVLVIPQRNVDRFTSLSPEEVSDLFQAAQRVGKVVEHVWKSTALTLSIQDGVDSGQTVPHTHIHVLPRRPGDFPTNDQIYDELQKHNIQGDLEQLVREKKLKMDSDRQPRTLEEMNKEAEMLSQYF